MRQWLSIRITTQELIECGAAFRMPTNWDPQLQQTLARRNTRAVWEP